MNGPLSKGIFRSANKQTKPIDTTNNLMKIKHILTCAAIIALAGLTVWYQESDNITQFTASAPSKAILESRKVTSPNEPMMVSGKLRVEIDSGTTTAEVPESDPHWKVAYEEAKKQRENLAKK